jgi:hypothetical protein
MARQRDPAGYKLEIPGGGLPMEMNWEAVSWMVLGLVLFGGWIIPVVVTSIAKNWRKVRESEHLAALKQSMIERGMSVEEMERVINLGKTPKGMSDAKGS